MKNQESGAGGEPERICGRQRERASEGMEVKANEIEERKQEQRGGKGDSGRKGWSLAQDSTLLLIGESEELHKVETSIRCFRCKCGLGERWK